MSIRLQIIRDYNGGGGSNASDVKIDRITLHMDNTYKLTMTVISRLNPIYQALITVISILTELLFTLIKLRSMTVISRLTESLFIWITPASPV